MELSCTDELPMYGVSSSGKFSVAFLIHSVMSTKDQINIKCTAGLPLDFNYTSCAYFVAYYSFKVKGATFYAP